MDTLTLPGATRFHNRSLTLSAYYALNLFGMNFFVDRLMLVSKGWNFFMGLSGTITNSQLFFADNRFVYLFF